MRYLLAVFALSALYGWDQSHNHGLWTAEAAGQIQRLCPEIGCLSAPAATMGAHAHWG
jgi:hypothetical protein